MKIIVAKNIGFCSGVRRSLEIARTSLEKDPQPVQFLGPVVHNEEVIKEIEKKGGRVISEPREAKSGTLIIRAHGVPPFFLPNKVIIRDTTCPLVKRVQKAAQDLLKDGYQVIIVGDKNHPEVKGMQGYIKQKGIVLESEAEAKKLQKFERIGLIAQTTQNLEKTQRILEILKEKTREIKFINTLCPEVIRRQKEISEIIKKVDGVLVVGSAISANTTQLVKIVKNSQKPVWLANSVKDIEKENFSKMKILGLISGTSAPDWIVEEIKKYLRKKFHD